MNFVEPIRDREKIAQIKNQLRGQRRQAERNRPNGDALCADPAGGCPSEAISALSSG